MFNVSAPFFLHLQCRISHTRARRPAHRSQSSIPQNLTCLFFRGNKKNTTPPSLSRGGGGGRATAPRREQAPAALPSSPPPPHPLLPHLLPANPSQAPEICSARAAMAETLDMTLDDIIKNNKKSNSSSGGRRSHGGSAPGGGGSRSGGVGKTGHPFKRSGNRQVPYPPPKVRTNRTGCCSASPGEGCRGFEIR